MFPRELLLTGANKTLDGIKLPSEMHKSSADPDG